MIPDEVIAEQSAYNEKIVEKVFRKLRLQPERLDFQGPRRRPEFLVHDSTGPLLVCEVKTVFSAGYMPERGAHVSSADPKFLNSGPFSIDVSFERMDAGLVDAVSKLRVLQEDRPELRNLPLTVAFFFDFFADHFRLYDRRMKRFPEVSGILKVETDHLIDKAARKMTEEELKERVESGSMAGLPPNTKTFRLVQNECAAVPLPAHFVAMCVVGPD